MIRFTNIAALLSTALFTLATTAAAQSADSRFEVRPFIGAYIPTGDQRDVLDDAITVGAQGAYAVTNNLSIVGTFSLTPSSNKQISLYDDVDVFTYDIGAELHKSFSVGSRGMRLSPFIGVGAGGRTYDYRDLDTNSETTFAGYGAIGGHVQRGSIGFRLEARDYVSSFKGLSGELTESETRNDVAIFTAISFSF
jgi:hypothetical protein